MLYGMLTISLHHKQYDTHTFFFFLPNPIGKSLYGMLMPEWVQRNETTVFTFYLPVLTLGLKCAC